MTLACGEGVTDPQNSASIHLTFFCRKSPVSTEVFLRLPNGGTTIIQNCNDCVKEGEGQLSDGKFYKGMDQDLTENHKAIIAQQLEAMLLRGEISGKVRNYLMVDKPHTSYLYLLSKIHKAIHPDPGRPIVSANESHTKRISTFVDSFLAPIVRKGRSFVHDTADFL